MCASTNAEVHAALVKNAAIPEGMTILADHQTAGRGQRGNSWQAPAGQNLTLSVLLRPTFLAVADQFALSIAVALAGLDTLRALLPATAGATARIKWPNDLYLADRKVGGILIENGLRGAQLSTSIVGIGLNVNQTVFDPALPNPTSLAVAAECAIERATAAAALLQHLEARYLALRGGAAERQRAEYLANLYRFGTPARFAFADGRPAATGTITGLDARGALRIRFAGGGDATFAVQEVRFID